MGFAIFCVAIFTGLIITLKQLSKDIEDWYELDFKPPLFKIWDQND